MSIKLDANSFLNNDIASPQCTNGLRHMPSTCNQTVGQMDHMLQDDFALPKESTNIFEELENFLKLNKLLENHDKQEDVPKDLSSYAKPTTIQEPPSKHEFSQYTDFLMPEESQHFHEMEPQLFSVRDGELQPITSPFMVPGIYKKVANALCDPPALSDSFTTEKQNVFITEKEPCGRVLSISRFHELYAFEQATTNGSSVSVKAASQRPVLLLEPLEEEVTDAVVVKPALGVLQSGTRAVPKQWDALSKLAYDILKLSNRDRIVIDRQRNEIVRTDNTTSQKTIYRLLSPECFGLTPHAQPPEVPSAKSPSKRRTYKGRQRKRKSTDAEPEREKFSNKLNKAQTPATETVPTQRTRFGRIVRTRLQPPSPTNAELDYDNPDDPPPPPPDSIEFIQNFFADLKDNDYRCSQPVSPFEHSSGPSSPQAKPLSAATSEQAKRKIPPEAICPTCNKIFLGRRLQRHFTQHPDHMQLPRTKQLTSPPPPVQQSLEATQSDADLTLFRYLVAKLQKSNLSEEQRADLFLSEINDFIAQLQWRSSRLIRNTSGLHFVSARCSRILGIPEGHYALDMTAIESEAPPPHEPESAAPCLLNFEHLSSSALPAPLAHGRSLEYTALSMSMDDTLTDEAAQKLNLSAGGKLLPPSEESLLRSVSDLVHDDIQKLNAASTTHLLHPPAPMPPVMHYDHASDNAVEAVSMKETPVNEQAAPILGLSVDFFQFNND